MSSAILSADTLNDFISPGVACIKPVEPLPAQQPAPEPASNAYEVTTEDKVAASAPRTQEQTAQISLTDCLACAGCVTSAEAVLVGLQSHEEVVNTLDAFESISIQEAIDCGIRDDQKVFVVSVSPQTRASIAATYRVSEKEAGHMIEQLFAGDQGVSNGGQKRSGFSMIIDTNIMREVCNEASVREVLQVLEEDRTVDGQAHDRFEKPKRPVLASACPGWVCYAEKKHPHVLPHLSRLKSPQALTGTLVKSVLSKAYGIPPDRVWHLAVMPCFDKKLEASREELTDAFWRSDKQESRGARDVDCVITARELVMLADSRGVSFPQLPTAPVRVQGSMSQLPDPTLNDFLFPRGIKRKRQLQEQASGPSGGYAYHIIRAMQKRTPESEIGVERGRNADVVEYVLTKGNRRLTKTARHYGFKNISNLVRKLGPQKAPRLPGSRAPRARDAGGLSDYSYIEVMACPGGCTNGGGQIKINDIADIRNLGDSSVRPGPAEQKEWLAQIDEAYYSASSSEADETDGMDVDGDCLIRSDDDIDEDPSDYINRILQHWSSITGIALNQLLLTSFRKVESDVGMDKKGSSDMDRVAGLASSLGGGW
ncbi:MAG: Cytosolic Fe-S cluster assembly factor nar1 [Chrysothrix sp. TS-e1954]|nr:MAG: Cytosolic Fe-S cluster assembly factor nar1 [Chrysothrix sp. TS-e1954]